MSIPLRVRHLLSSQNISLSDFIISQLDMSSEYFFELLDLGAIYLNQVRCFQNQTLSPGDYVRVHISPKRFPQILVDTKDLVVADEPDFVVVQKPQGYPCHHLVDNCREDLLSQLEKILGFKLYLTHRLDIGTGGLWLIAKTAEFQKQFNQQLQNKEVHKKYFARVEGSWREPRRQLTHYMKPALRAPREVFDISQDGYLKCDLEIQDIIERNETFSDLKINLLTGRTHQIRAQVAHLQHPVLGDTMYGSKTNFGQGPLEKWALWAVELEFKTDRAWKFELSSNQIDANLRDLVKN